METRGAAPSAVCPRCGEESPPSDAPLITCARCKLGFDPRAEPVARPTRRAEPRELVRAPRGIAIERTRERVTIRYGFERLKGAGALLLGLVCAAMLIGNLRTPGEDVGQLVALGVSALLMFYVGALMAFTDRVLRIDGRQITATREPFGVGRNVRLLRADVDEVGVGPSDRGWQVAVRGTGGARLLALVPRKDAADCIAEVLREALAEIPWA